MFQTRFKIQVMAAVVALAILISSGTIVYHFLEGWTWVQSLYFVVVTLATVGYGDLHPTNDITRLFTIFFILFGVTIAVSSLGVIGSQYLARNQDRILKRSDKRNGNNGQA